MERTAENDVVVSEAGIAPGNAVHEALQARAEIMAMTQATHDAALTPKDPGGISHAERAALAARIARLNADEALAQHYETLMRAASATPDIARVADPAFKGEGRRMQALIAYTDLASVSPKDTVATDIEGLQEAGVSDADIVRLAELNAFLAYQVRLIAGLRLMKGLG
ncbi:MAG: hypothetical protein WBA88_14730 [Pseudaminobacter sp.]